MANTFAYFDVSGNFMKTLYIIILTTSIVTLGCNNNSPNNNNGGQVDNVQKILSSQDSISTKTTTKIINQKESPIHWHTIENSDFRNVWNPATFSDSTKVYSKPDTNSKVLQVFKFNTNLQLMKEGEIDGEIISEVVKEDGTKFTQKKYTYFRWYEIVLGNDLGYVKWTDIVVHSLMSSDNKYKYFIRCCFPPDNNMNVLKYSFTSKKFVDTFDLLSSAALVVKPIDHNGWKNVNLLFRITNISATCGGGRDDTFVIDANDSLSILTTSGYTNIEDITQEDDYEAVIYLPIKFGNGKILLVETGNVEQIFDTYKGDLKVYSLPANLTIPEQELIIKKINTEKAVLNAQGKPVFIKKGICKTQQTNSTNFYKWNGRKLVLIKKTETSNYSTSNAVLEDEEE